MTDRMAGPTAQAEGDTGPDPSVYGNRILAEIPRVLGLMDREAHGATAGCCDRTYWAWKFTDFPGARFQESVCALAFAWSTSMPGNRYHASPRLLGWIASALRFWASIQHRDGSFDEAYPYERSLAATSFTAFYVGEALDFLGEALDQDSRVAVLGAMHRAGDWLTRNDESHGVLSNHLAAASGALWHVHRLTGDARYRRRAEFFLDRIMSRQSPEGWYEEYGGADPGYQTHGSFYLARCLEFSGDSRLADSLRRANAFLAHCVHPDGSIGGEYGSRNTKTYYPAAFEMLSGQDASAAWIAAAMRRGAPDAAVGVEQVDQYNYFPFLNNLVFAHRALSSRTRQVTPAPPPPRDGLTWFPAAGIGRFRSPRYEAWIGTRKGGVLKVFDRESHSLVYNDGGYVGSLRGSGGLASTQYDDAARPVEVRPATSTEPTTIEVHGAFMTFERPTMSPWRFIAFRAMTLSLARLPAVGRWLKRLLVRVLIYRKDRLGIDFRRRITLRAEELEIVDDLNSHGSHPLASLEWVESFSTIHMGSARYFVANDLAPSRASASSNLDVRQVAHGLVVRRTVPFA